MSPQPQIAHPYRLSMRAFAWAVHGYTACGALLAFAMTVAVVHGRNRLAFLLMVVATVIGATGGGLRGRVRAARPGQRRDTPLRWRPPGRYCRLPDICVRAGATPL